MFGTVVMKWKVQDVRLEAGRYHYPTYNFPNKTQLPTIPVVQAATRACFNAQVTYSRFSRKKFQFSLHISSSMQLILLPGNSTTLICLNIIFTKIVSGEKEKFLLTKAKLLEKLLW